MKLLENKIVLFLLLVALGAGLFFAWQKIGRVIEVDHQASVVQTIGGKNVSPLSGLACDNYQRRPMAIVFANDPVARPLIGLSKADLVLEMPVITNSITRVIAVYQCESPDEIGSLRSARHDFIPLTIGFDAILAHWGGSHFALDELDAGVMDNIDAMKNPYNAYYQKSSIPQPHNGFTSIDRLVNAAKRLGYRMESNFEGYPHNQKDKSQTSQRKVLRIDYSYPYNVSYQYEPESNSYFRYRTNLKEIDRADNQQIEAKNIVVMRSFSKQIQGPDYNDLDLEGSGECQVYQNGIVIDCTWQKSEKNPTSKLKFLDKDNKEIPFIPGQTWVQIVEPNQNITWQ